MPIYEQTYRRYEARAPLRQVRFWPITRESLRLVLMKRAFLGLLALSFLPFLVRVIQVYGVTRLPDVERFAPLDARLFGQFLNWQVWLCCPLLLTIFGGAGLIASDLRTGAIVMYLSRPLTRRDYIVGKLLVTTLLNLATTLVPGILLYGVALALAPERFAVLGLLWIGPAIVLHSVVISLSIASVGLALSSLTNRVAIAGLSFFILVMGLEGVRAVFDAAFGRPEIGLLSLQENLTNLGRALFGLTDRTDALPWPASAIALAFLAVGCVVVLRRRVRAVEIVS